MIGNPKVRSIDIIVHTEVKRNK